MSGISERFWEQVAERAAPDEFEVGQIVIVEEGGRQSWKVIAETWIDGHGNHQARVRDATPTEVAADAGPHTVIVVPEC